MHLFSYLWNINRIYVRSLWHSPFFKLSLKMDPQTLFDSNSRFFSRYPWVATRIHEHECISVEEGVARGVEDGPLEPFLGSSFGILPRFQRIRIWSLRINFWTINKKLGKAINSAQVPIFSFRMRYWMKISMFPNIDKSWFLWFSGLVEMSRASWTHYHWPWGN